MATVNLSTGIYDENRLAAVIPTETVASLEAAALGGGAVGSSARFSATAPPGQGAGACTFTIWRAGGGFPATQSVGSAALTVATLADAEAGDVVLLSPGNSGGVVWTVATVLS